MNGTSEGSASPPSWRASCACSQARCSCRKRSPETRLARIGRVSRAPRSSTLSLSRRARGSRTRCTSIVRPSSSASGTTSRSTLRGVLAIRRCNRKGMDKSIARNARLLTVRECAGGAMLIAPFAKKGAEAREAGDGGIWLLAPEAKSPSVPLFQRGRQKWRRSRNRGAE